MEIRIFKQSKKIEAIGRSNGTAIIASSNVEFKEVI